MLGTLQDEDDIADLKELVKKQKEENEQRNRDLQEKVSKDQRIIQKLFKTTRGLQVFLCSIKT